MLMAELAGIVDVVEIFCADVVVVSVRCAFCCSALDTVMFFSNLACTIDSSVVATKVCASCILGVSGAVVGDFAATWVSVVACESSVGDLDVPSLIVALEAGALGKGFACVPVADCIGGASVSAGARFVGTCAAVDIGACCVGDRKSVV